MTQTALITGASSGLGREMATLLARDGYRLILVARDQARLEALAAQLPTQAGAAKVVAMDLSVPGAAEELVDLLGREGLRVDILVNNAGFNEYGPFLQTDGEREMGMIRLHVALPTHLSKLLLPAMIEAGQGRILNVASTGSFQPVPTNAVYGATKAYLLSFSEALSEELRGTGVTVTALCPGATATEFAARAGIEDIRLFQWKTMVMKPGRVAKIGYRAMMAGRRVVVPGLMNRALTILTGFLPRWVVARMATIFMARAGGCSCGCNAARKACSSRAA